MSRSGYTDDCELDQKYLAMYRGAVMSAIRGKRGQALLREMREAMDAMPDKRLVREELVCADGVCALGTVAIKRGMDVSQIDPEEPYRVAAAFGVNEKIVREIAWENDEFRVWTPKGNDPDDQAARWAYMRKWLDRHIIEPAVQP